MTCITEIGPRLDAAGIDSFTPRRALREVMKRSRIDMRIPPGFPSYLILGDGTPTLERHKALGRATRSDLRESAETVSQLYLRRRIDRQQLCWRLLAAAQLIELLPDESTTVGAVCEVGQVAS